MKLRPILLALLLIGVFIYWTASGRWSPYKSGKLWTSPEAASSYALTPDENSNITIYRSASPATVNITSVVYQRDWFFQVFPVRDSGSGFFIDGDGRILTNYHVVSGNAPAIEVTLENKGKYKARVLAVDQRNDLALIKVEPRGKLPFLKLGDSDNLLVGQKVLAIGNPFGLEGTLTTGIVSSLGRTIRDENGRALEDMIQTDAAINPGNSGGPLLDSHGDVIAINTAIYGPGSNIGIGFAMPINRAKTMLADLSAHGRVVRPYIGVTTMFVDGDTAEALGLPNRAGLLIQQVEPGSAGDQAGLRGSNQEVVVDNIPVEIGGDLIVAVDGQPVSSSSALRRAIDRKKAGDRLQLTIIRGKRQMEVAVTLGEAPQRL